MRAVLALAALLLFAAGCTGLPATAPTPAPGPASTVTVTATPSPDPSVTATTDAITPTSLEDFREQLEADGLTCDDWDVTVENVQGSCDDLIILAFNDGTKKHDEFFRASSFLAWSVIRDKDRGDDVAVLLGDNWWARLSLEDAQTLRDDLDSGGVILH